jgi:DNA-binding MarR family transcriptional regulator
MQVYMSSAIQEEAQAFLSAWFDTRRIIQTLNFNRFQQEGLSATQFILLNMIGEAGGGSTAADLARRLNVDVTTTMRTAESLAVRGLLRKAKDPGDRRRSFLTLTAKGRKIHGRIHQAFIDQVVAAFVAMPAKARSDLVDGLVAFVAASSSSRDMAR